MGGESHNPDSEIDDRSSVSKASVSGAKSSRGGQGHANMDHDFGDAYSGMGSVGGHRGHGPGQNSYHDDMHPTTRSVPGGAHGGRGLGSRGMADQMHDMSMRDPDRPLRTEIARLRKKHRDLSAYLSSLSHLQLTPQEYIREEAETKVYLQEIVEDVREWERRERSDSKPCHGMGPSSHYHDSVDYAGEESDCQLRGSRRGHHYPPAGHGHHPSRHPNDEMEPPSHYDSPYYAAEMSEYQPRGSRHRPHLPPSGHGGHSGRHARHFPGR